MPGTAPLAQEAPAGPGAGGTDGGAGGPGGALQRGTNEEMHEARQKEETCFTMEKQLHERDNQILQLKLKGSDAEQNKNNLEMELNELNSEVNALKRSSQEQASSVEELKAQIETRTEELRVKTSDLSAMQETAERGYICAIEAAVAMMENIKHVEDVESVACSSFSLTYQSHHLSDLLTTSWPNDQAKQVNTEV